MTTLTIILISITIASLFAIIIKAFAIMTTKQPAAKTKPIAQKSNKTIFTSDMNELNTTIDNLKTKYTFVTLVSFKSTFDGIESKLLVGKPIQKDCVWEQAYYR